MVVAAPVIDLLHGIATGEDRTCLVAFIEKLPAYCSRFQLPGISHFAGTSTHSLIDVLSCKTTPSRAPSADE